MTKYLVEKRVINNYLVEVEANTPEEAIRRAADGLHGPGQQTSENEDGDDFYPSEWRVYNPKERGETGSGEINYGIDRSSLTDLD